MRYHDGVIMSYNEENHETITYMFFRIDIITYSL